MSNFRSVFDDKFNPRELHLDKKLLKRETKETSSGQDIEIALWDISRDFQNLGFTALGVTLTLDNTGIWKNGTPGRIPNGKAAKELERKLNELIKKLLSTIPVWCAWVFERHRNGSPHIHALLFVPVRDLVQAIQKCKAVYNEDAVRINVLSPSYIFKNEKWEWALVEKEDDFLAASCSRLLARTALEINERENKLTRRNVAAVRDVQKTKELHRVFNAKLRKKYPSADLILSNLFGELWRHWKFTHCRTRQEKLEDEALGVTKPKRLIEREYEGEPKPFEVDKYVIMQPNLGCFGRDVACKLKTKVDDTLQQLDVTLWTKNNTERLHVNLKNVYLSKKQIENLKLWAKKCLTKNDLLVLYRTLFSGKKICGRNPLRMLDFVPKDLSDYDCELLQNRFDIRSWLAFAFPLIRAQKQDDTSDFDAIAFLATCGLDEFFRPIPEPAPPELCSV
jgi:hypothetical protein|nr:MAG TPA: replication protein A [Bacteriophage sp.]